MREDVSIIIILVLFLFLYPSSLFFSIRVSFWLSPSLYLFEHLWIHDLKVAGFRIWDWKIQLGQFLLILSNLFHCFCSFVSVKLNISDSFWVSLYKCAKNYFSGMWSIWTELYCQGWWIWLLHILEERRQGK